MMILKKLGIEMDIIDQKTIYFYPRETLYYLKILQINDIVFIKSEQML